MNTINIIDLDDARDDGVSVLGTKGWYLAQLRACEFPTPAGFVITMECYRDAIRNGRIQARLQRIWDAARRAEPTRLASAVRSAQHLISEVSIDASSTALIDQYVAAQGPRTEFAVRSSVGPDGVSGPGSAGVHVTSTNVVGTDQVVAGIHSCWASLFSERALSMRARGLGDSEPAMAVVVQRMIPAERSGIAVPLAVDSHVLVEATFGLGEPIASGTVQPDRYVIDAAANDIQSVVVGRKQVVLPSDARGRHAFAPVTQQHRRVLDDDDIVRIGRLCTQVAVEFGGPHEIEWVLDPSGITILQARAVELGLPIVDPSIDRMVAGIGIGIGTASGHVRVIDTSEDLVTARPGEVIVASETIPEWRSHLLRAAAIVTDDGDAYSHAAHLAREFGIPAVVGTTNATAHFDNGDLVTVDALRGWILPTPR